MAKLHILCINPIKPTHKIPDISRLYFFNRDYNALQIQNPARIEFKKSMHISLSFVYCQIKSPCICRIFRK